VLSGGISSLLDDLAERLANALSNAVSWAVVRRIAVFSVLSLSVKMEIRVGSLSVGVVVADAVDRSAVTLDAAADLAAVVTLFVIEVSD